MSPIMQALARRQMGPLGGGGTPLQQQSSLPTHSLPTGGSAAPTQGQPQPNGSLSAMPTQVQQGTQNGALQASQQAQGPSFDPETRDLAKSLVQKLLKGL